MFSLISFIDSVSVPLFTEDMWNGAIGEMAVHDASTSRAGNSGREVAKSGEIIRKKAGAIAPFTAGAYGRRCLLFAFFRFSLLSFACRFI